MTMMKAAVLLSPSELVIEDVEIDPPKKGEVKIAVKACGICHSDYSIVQGLIRQPLPQVIGHEGAGIVVEVGEGVSRLSVGDRVITHLAPSCGNCRPCLSNRRTFCEVGMYNSTGLQIDRTSRLRRRGGTQLTATRSLGVLAEYAVISELAAVKVVADIAFDKACLLGCGVITGVGAVINTAHVRPGETVVVIGCGGIGLSVIQGARLAGASVIIAVDISEYKLELARQVGATQTFNTAKDTDVADRIRSLTGGGADHAFDAAGGKTVIELALSLVRPGGAAILIGLSGIDKTMDRIASDRLIYDGKSIRGSKYGNANPDVDFPMLIQQHQNGNLDLDVMVTRTYDLEGTSQAFQDMENNKNARGVVVF